MDFNQSISNSILFIIIAFCLIINQYGTTDKFNKLELRIEKLETAKQR